MKVRSIAPIVVLLVLSGAASAQPPPGDPSASERAPAVDFGKGAEEVAARLRELVRSLSDDDAFAQLEAEVAADTRRVADYWDETGRLLARNLRTAALDSLTTSWQALRSDLENLDGQTDVRARRREADLATLTSLHDAWTRALDLAHKADAPPVVVDRVQNTLTAIDETRPAIEQRRARVLVLQDAVTRAQQSCDDALVRIGDARREAIRRAFTPQEPPIWRDRATQVVRGVEPGFGIDLATKIEALRIYATAYRAQLAGSLLVVLLVLFALHRVSTRASDGDGESAPSIVRRPYAAATLIGILLSRPLRPNPPYEFQQMMLVVVMVASIRIFRPVLEARLAAVVYVCCALLVVSLVGQLMEPDARIEQVLLIVEMSVAAVALGWAAVRLLDARPLVGTRPLFGRVVRTVIGVLAAVSAASAIAAAFGYLDLADFLGLNLFYALLLTFGVLAIRVAVRELITMSLSRGPLTRFRAIARHRAVIDRRARAVVDVVLASAWTSMVLARYQLLEPLRQIAAGVLATRLKAGELDLPVSQVLAFVVVLLVVFATTRLVGTVLEEDLYSRMTLPRGVPYALSTLTRYALLLAGLLLALATLGLDLTRITVLVSALGLGLGFGLQQVMNNFVSGLILLFERPVNVGDSIQMADLSGDILRIGIRSSTIRTSQGAEVIVPNSKMIEEKVTNWTLSDRRRRIDLEIGIKGYVDAERIMAMLVDVARQDPRVLQAPPPEALLVRFGEDATDFELRFWTDDAHWMRLRSDLSVTIQRTLRAVRVEGADRTSASAQGS